MIVLEAGEEVKVTCPRCHGSGMVRRCHLCEDGVTTARLEEDLEVDADWVREQVNQPEW